MYVLCVFSVICLYMFDSENLKFLHTTDVYVNFASGPIMPGSFVLFFDLASNLLLIYHHTESGVRITCMAWWDQK